MGMIRGLLLVLLALTVAAPAHGHSARRDILALYDGSENPAPDMTQIHQALETPLNHMGYRLVYRELTQGLPPPDQLGGYKAVVAWFESDTTMEPDFFAAASAAIDAGVKWILVG